MVEVPRPLEPFTELCCPWQQAFCDCLKQMFPNYGLCLPALPCFSTEPLPEAVENKRAQRWSSSQVCGMSIQTFTVDVSCFEVDTACTQESTLKRTRPHLFPSFQGAGSALPFLPVRAQGCTQHLLPTDLPSRTGSHTAEDSQGTQESRERQVSLKVHQVGF